MRPTYKPPMKRKYFHKKQKISKKDMAFLKNKMEVLQQKKIKEGLDEKEKKMRWRK